MEYRRILQELYNERTRVDRAIKELESLAAGPGFDGGAKRRGRKSMGPEERREVSARMQKYWAARRREHK